METQKIVIILIFVAFVFCFLFGVQSIEGFNAQEPRTEFNNFHIHHPEFSKTKYHENMFKQIHQALTFTIDYGYLLINYLSSHAAAMKVKAEFKPETSFDSMLEEDERKVENQINEIKHITMALDGKFKNNSKYEYLRNSSEVDEMRNRMEKAIKNLFFYQWLVEKYYSDRISSYSTLYPGFKYRYKKLESSRPSIQPNKYPIEDTTKAFADNAEKEKYLKLLMDFGNALTTNTKNQSAYYYKILTLLQQFDKVFVMVIGDDGKETYQLKPKDTIKSTLKPTLMPVVNPTLDYNLTATSQPTLATLTYSTNAPRAHTKLATLEPEVNPTPTSFYHNTSVPTVSASSPTSIPTLATLAPTVAVTSSPNVISTSGPTLEQTPATTTVASGLGANETFSILSPTPNTTQHPYLVTQSPQTTRAGSGNNFNGYDPNQNDSQIASVTAAYTQLPSDPLPTLAGTLVPTLAGTQAPTNNPTNTPTNAPTEMPTATNAPQQPQIIKIINNNNVSCAGNNGCVVPCECKKKPQSRTLATKSTVCDCGSKTEAPGMPAATPTSGQKELTVQINGNQITTLTPGLTKAAVVTESAATPQATLIPTLTPTMTPEITLNPQITSDPTMTPTPTPKEDYEPSLPKPTIQITPRPPFRTDYLPTKVPISFNIGSIPKSELDHLMGGLLMKVDDCFGSDSHDLTTEQLNDLSSDAIKSNMHIFRAKLRRKILHTMMEKYAKLQKEIRNNYIKYRDTYRYKNKRLLLQVVSQVVCLARYIYLIREVSEPKKKIPAFKYSHDQLYGQVECLQKKYLSMYRHYIGQGELQRFVFVLERILNHLGEGLPIDKDCNYMFDEDIKKTPAPTTKGTSKATPGVTPNITPNETPRVTQPSIPTLKPTSKPTVTPTSDLTLDPTRGPTRMASSSVTTSGSTNNPTQKSVQTSGVTRNPTQSITKNPIGSSVKTSGITRNPTQGPMGTSSPTKNSVRGVQAGSSKGIQTKGTVKPKVITTKMETYQANKVWKNYKHPKGISHLDNHGPMNYFGPNVFIEDMANVQ